MGPNRTFRDLMRPYETLQDLTKAYRSLQDLTFSEVYGRAEVEEVYSKDTLECDDDTHKAVVCT